MKPEDDVDAARMFIRTVLDGKFKQARTLVLPDSTNIEWLNLVERSYLKKNDVIEQRGLREANIIVHDVKRPDESTTIMVYSNSFKNKKDSVKAVRKGGEWLVDLKFTFQPGMEAAQ